jgi:hypothetical protein
MKDDSQDRSGESLPFALDSAMGRIDNGRMKNISGRVKNGVVVLDNGLRLPEGAAVTVVPRKSPSRVASTRPRRVVFPLVRSKHPGTLHLTNQRIAEILEQEDIATLRESFRQAKS